MDLTNSSAIVTGGAGGFGSATVPWLAQKGAKVVIADVSGERGEALAREVGADASLSIRIVIFLWSFPPLLCAVCGSLFASGGTLGFARGS